MKVEEKSVHVEYTDSGKTAILERRDLRKQLKDRLFALPPQAVKCRLADLPPPNVSHVMSCDVTMIIRVAFKVHTEGIC